jgi:hypothetical protein
MDFNKSKGKIASPTFAVGHLWSAQPGVGCQPGLETGEGKAPSWGDGGIGQSGSLTAIGGGASMLEQL